MPESLKLNAEAILARCICAGIYATNTSDTCYYISEHRQAEIIIVECNKQLIKYANMKK
jgi:long-subunit acyl-CoA synthetase (AMP-forming)